MNIVSPKYEPDFFTDDELLETQKILSMNGTIHTVDGKVTVVLPIGHGFLEVSGMSLGDACREHGTRELAPIVFHVPESSTLRHPHFTSNTAPPRDALPLRCLHR